MELALTALKLHFYINLGSFLGAALRGDSSSPSPNQVLTKRRLQDLLHEIDPREQMDDDVEDVSFQVVFRPVGWGDEKKKRQGDTVRYTHRGIIMHIY